MMKMMPGKMIADMIPKAKLFQNLSIRQGTKNSSPEFPSAYHSRLNRHAKVRLIQSCFSGPIHRYLVHLVHHCENNQSASNNSGQESQSFYQIPLSRTLWFVLS